jgi:N-acetylglucosaminyldiphosphoundecaprenol N-acetyl-beta-D-mannosaminyltransferase
VGVDFHREVYCLLGLPFDAVDLGGAVQRVRDAAMQRIPCIISTANVNFLVGCRTDRQFRDTVVNSDLSVADGMPLIWIARLLGIPIRQRVTGSDLFERLRHDPGNRLSVFFFGGRDGVAAMASRQLNRESKALFCVGYESPGFGSVDDMSHEETIQRVNASEADFVVVSLGARKGHLWIERNRLRLNAPVISHLGAVLNFTAGTVDRAPPWIQNIGLEWLWRIKEEPMLWRRYLQDGLGLLYLLVGRVLPYLWDVRNRKAHAVQHVTGRVEAGEEQQEYLIRLHGTWVKANLDPLRDHFSRAAGVGKDVELEMSGVTCVDSAFIGLVMLLQGHQVQHGRKFLMHSVAAPVRRFMKHCCAEYLCSDYDYVPAPSISLEPVPAAQDAPSSAS